jgi:maltooligosyltrehalose trehalohydrolase
MHHFTLWAPAAAAVEVVVDNRSFPMRPERGGWWAADVDGGPAGSRYGFRLDGGPVRPDPRSPWQPDGVHGLSATVDHAAFAWHDAGWRGLALPGAVLYELHVGTFSEAGAFDGVIEHLDHLVALGVDAIELMPVCEFPGRRGWGYDGVDLYAPHHALGGPDGLKRLVDACHGAGLGVVFDVVYNHLGPSGNYLGEFGPYFTDRYHTAWGAAVNVDGPGSDEVRRFIIDNAVMWLRDYHGDGLRLDAVHAIVDTSAIPLLEQLAVEIDALAALVRKPLFVIAESDRNDPAIVRPRGVGGCGLDAAWADEWHHALHAVLTGETNGYYADFGSMPALAKALQQAWVHDGTRSTYRDRVYGRSPAGLGGHQFVIATQTHDQVGNRAAGERLAALTTEGRLKVAAALLLTAPFVPMLFMGEEWAASTPFQYFTDHEDPELGRAVTEGRRREFEAFGWDPQNVPDPQAVETFERSKLQWTEAAHGSDSEHGRVLEWYRRLIALRRSTAALNDPRFEATSVTVDDDGLISVIRGDVTVVANIGTRARRVPVPRWRVLTASEQVVELENAAVILPPDTVAIFTPDPR